MNKALLTLSSVAAIVFSGVVGYAALSEVVTVHQTDATTVITYTNPMAR